MNKKAILKKYFNRSDTSGLYVPKPGFEIQLAGRRIARIEALGDDVTYIYLSYQFTDDSAVRNWDRAEDAEFNVFQLTEVELG